MQHINDENLVKKTIQKKWNFEQFIEEAGERGESQYRSQ